MPVEINDDCLIMKKQDYILLIIFLAYCTFLLWIEWQYGQLALRQYVTDLKGEVFFYGVNTTLNLVALWGTALLFSIAILMIDREQAPRIYLFYLSQIIFFSYLGLDERFIIHEKMGLWLEINDAYLLFSLGLVELGLLFLWGQCFQQPFRILFWLYSAAILFAVMVFIDAKLPSNLVWRLAFEELSKLGAGLSLFRFAWEIVVNHIRQLQRKQPVNEF